MAVYFTLASLVERVRQAADLEGSDGPVSDNEIKAQLGLSLRRLYERLLLARGQEYYRKTAELNVTPGQALYELPADFFQLLAVVAADAAVMAVPSATFAESDSGNEGSWTRLTPFSMAELAPLLGSAKRSQWLQGDLRFPRYRLRGTQLPSGELPSGWIGETLELRPAPVYAWTLRIEYLPAALVATGDTWQVNGVHGWEEVAVLEVAAYCLAKQEQDARYLLTRVQQEYARIDSLARARDAGSPEPGIVDTCGLLDSWAPDGGRGYGRGWLS